MIKQNVLLIVMAVVLTGCGGKVAYQSPPPVITKGLAHQVSKSAILSQTTGTLKHLNDEGDILYFQNFGGGGVAVGLFLGPLGVAANAAAIESNTEEDVEQLKGKLSLTPKVLFDEVKDNHSVQFILDQSNSVKLSPYLYISKTEDEQLLFASAMLVETQDAMDEKWLGKYMYQTNIKMPKESIVNGLSPEDYQLLEAELIKGFDSLLQLYISDLEGGLITENAVTFRSEFLSPRFDFELLGDILPSEDDRVNIRTAGGVYSLPRDEVELKIKKKKKT